MISELSTIQSRIGHAKDHVIDESRFVGRMSDQNLVVHVGYFSAVRQDFVSFPKEV
jgi:hypothetical protein